MKFNVHHCCEHAVSTMEVTSIARQWNINVGDFMRSARARLSCQHPTSKYSMSGETDADVVNVWVLMLHHLVLRFRIGKFLLLAPLVSLFFVFFMFATCQTRLLLHSCHSASTTYGRGNRSTLNCVWKLSLMWGQLYVRCSITWQTPTKSSRYTQKLALP